MRNFRSKGTFRGYKRLEKPYTLNAIRKETIDSVALSGIRPKRANWVSFVKLGVRKFIARLTHYEDKNIRACDQWHLIYIQ